MAENPDADSKCPVCNSVVRLASSGALDIHEANGYRCMGSGKKPGSDRVCSLEGCEGEYYGKGFCVPHYMRWWRTGDPLPQKREPLKIKRRGGWV